MKTAIDVTIAIPFYRHPYLVEPLMRSLDSVSFELAALKAAVVIINDSPDDDLLAAELEKWKNPLEAYLPVSVFTNRDNLGFVESANIAMELSADTGSDLILLNSDCIPAPGAFRELRKIAYADPMIGFVCPRTNNATICSLPYSMREQSTTYEEAYRLYSEIAPSLPEWNFIPTAVGFCIYIKNKILRDFGFFDVIFSPGYNEENDFAMRANRCGYRAALANRAFVFHAGSLSFGTEIKSQHEELHSRMLHERYPEYEASVSDYVDSPSFLFERNIEKATLGRSGKDSRWAIDLSHFRCAYNGTYELGIHVARSIAAVAPPKVSLTLVCGKDAAKFHGFANRLPDFPVLGPDTDDVFDAVIKPTQPFSFDDLAWMAEHGLNSFVFMLDTIASDCLYIKPRRIDAIWSVLGDFTDGVLFISKFSQDQFNRRYTLLDQPKQLACQLSVHVDDYTASELELATARPEISSMKGYVFVVGNHYAHKFVDPTVNLIRTSFPGLQVVAIGDREDVGREVQFLRSGTLSRADIAQLYQNAGVVVFPSHYEGFGFPVVNALAAGKDVIVRASELNREIGERWTGEGRLFLFDDGRDLIRLLEIFVGGLQTEEILESHQVRSKNGDVYDWVAFGRSVEAFVGEIIRENSDLRRYRQRLARLHNYGEFAFDYPQGARAAIPPLESRVRELESIVDGIYKSTSWKVTAPLRGVKQRFWKQK